MMLPYKQHIQNCFANEIGEAGIEKDAFKNTLLDLNVHLNEIKNASLPLVSFIEQDKDVDEILLQAEKLRAKFDCLVVLGTGGSILNPKTFCALKKAQADKEIFLADTVDPEVFEKKINKLDLTRTAFLAVSKSGGTIETISQTLICLDITQKILGKSFQDHWFFITDPVENTFSNLAKEIDATLLEHPKDIGGRYSGLTQVGLLPAAFLGIDIRAIRNGAKKILNDIKENGKQSLSAQGAALYACFLQKKVQFSVMLPYIERLLEFTDWYCQIVAESLGKEGKGFTPIRAIGPLDQHSQLQLFLDGPKNKFINMVTQREHQSHYVIDNKFKATASFSYIDQSNLSDILCAEQQATIEALKIKHCPVRHIEMEKLNEEVLGGLVMQMMLEVILVGRLMGVNPFDQPAVELGKVRTKELLTSYQKAS